MEILLEKEFTPLNSNINTAVRIKFSGNSSVENYHFTSKEGERFYSEWTEYLEGSKIIGGTYMIEESNRSVIISLNFSLIAYIENGKIY